MDFRKAPRELSSTIFITEQLPSGGARVSHPHLSGAGDRASLPSIFFVQTDKDSADSVTFSPDSAVPGDGWAFDHARPKRSIYLDSPFPEQSISELWSPRRSIRMMLELKMKTSKQ